MDLYRNRRPGRYAICVALATIGGAAVARFGSTGSRRAAWLSAALRQHPHWSHVQLADQLDTDTLMVFGLSFVFLLGLTCLVTWLVTRRRDGDMDGLPKPRRRRKAATQPSGGFGAFYGPGGWYGGPQ